MFNGSDAGGAYNAQYITVTGTFTRTAASYFSEASILVTPPTGTPFVIQPFTTATTAVAGGAVVTTATVPAGSYTVPISAITTAGVWSFEFFDRWDDVAAAADGTWGTVTVTMQDGTPPAAAPIGAVGHTFNNVPVTGTTALPGFDQSFTVPAGTTVAGVRVRGQGSVASTETANTNGNSPLNLARFRVTPPGGTPILMAIFPQFGASTSVSELIVSLPAAIDSGAGAWRVETFTALAGTDSFMQSLAVELLPPTAPTAVDLGTLVANTAANGSATVTAAGQTKWFKFTMNDTLDAVTNKGLEIDTEGSTTTDGANLNTSVCLFSGATGARINADFADGTQSLGTLTFGIDNHPAPGDGLPYNGRDGAALASGTYYVAVTAGDTGVTYQPGLFGVTNTSTQLGPIALHVKLVDPGVTVPAATDLGTVAGNGDGTEHITSSTATLAAAQVKWFKLTTGGDALGGNGKFVDISTDPASTIDDTEIGLYRTDGALIGTDDDDGVGFKSFLSFGNGGGTTAGEDGDIGGLPTLSDGRDGELTAGTYYLAVGAFDTTFGNSFWFANSTSVDIGDVTVNIATNVTTPGSICGAAVVGVAGADNHLDNNDFVVFIDLFFNHNAIADMGSTGGTPGADGAWDNNDFVVFIDNFFTAPASCR
jgi:hypothetical protein